MQQWVNKMTSKEVRPTILKDTTLCMIVRDEKMNPAGGIERFAAAHIPHVEEAVIVDTGSVDGTREILERLESQYPNLRVLDRPFDGYSNSRNFSLDQSRTKYNLVLDADELLTEKSPTNDWEDLKEIMEEVDIEMTAFLGLDILADGREHRYSSCPALRRLFLNERKYRYLGEVWERIPADFGLFLPIELKMQ